MSFLIHVPTLPPKMQLYKAKKNDVWSVSHLKKKKNEIPWMEEPGGLQSMGSQRVGHD